MANYIPCSQDGYSDDDAHIDQHAPRKRLRARNDQVEYADAATQMEDEEENENDNAGNDRTNLVGTRGLPMAADTLDAQHGGVQSFQKNYWPKKGKGGKKGEAASRAQELTAQDKLNELLRPHGRLVSPADMQDLERAKADYEAKFESIKDAAAKKTLVKDLAAKAADIKAREAELDQLEGGNNAAKQLVDQQKGQIESLKTTIRKLQQQLADMAKGHGKNEERSRALIQELESQIAEYQHLAQRSMDALEDSIERQEAERRMEQLNLNE